MVLAQSKSSRWSFAGTVFQRISTAAAQALQNLLFFLGEGSTVVVILSPLTSSYRYGLSSILRFRQAPRVALIRSILDAYGGDHAD
jgi:hypothetical protein